MSGKGLFDSAMLLFRKGSIDRYVDTRLPIIGLGRKFTRDRTARVYTDRTLVVLSNGLIQIMESSILAISH